MAFELDFGFRPLPLDLSAGPITVETLDVLEEYVVGVQDSENIYQGWIYAPRQQIVHLGTDEIREAPYSARVFGLPKTHVIRHDDDVVLGHLQFHIWVLSFLTGQRLSATEAGYLDATPLKPGKLNDFSLLGDSLAKAVLLAEAFWCANSKDRVQIARYEAAIHALFLSQNPRFLQFEGFIYLYTALDACFAMTKKMLSGPHPRSHAERTAWMCGQYGIPLPDWAKPSGKVEVSDIRNPTIHEGLYMGEPLGFAIEGRGSSRNLNLEMQALVCRLLVAILGGTSSDYVSSPVTTRQTMGLMLP